MIEARTWRHPSSSSTSCVFIRGFKCDQALFLSVDAGGEAGRPSRVRIRNHLSAPPGKGRVRAAAAAPRPPFPLSLLPWLLRHPKRLAALAYHAVADVVPFFLIMCAGADPPAPRLRAHSGPTARPGSLKPTPPHPTPHPNDFYNFFSSPPAHARARLPAVSARCAPAVGEGG